MVVPSYGLVPCCITGLICSSTAFKCPLSYPTRIPNFLAFCSNIASTWEIRNLNTSSKSGAAKCLVTQMLELHAKGWFKWKSDFSPKFERTIPFALLSQVAG